MRPVGLVVALGLLMGLLAATEVWQSRAQATRTAEQSAGSLVRLVAEQTERTIQAIDLTLIFMRDALRVAPALPADDPAYRAALRERLKDIPFVRALFVIGPDGFITHDTDYPSTPRVSFADRGYFRIHQEDSEVGLYIGEPLRSRSVGVWFVGLSRRIDNPDGSFGGTVVAAVEPRYFSRLFADIASDEDSLIALCLKDGALVARTPYREDSIGKSFTGSAGKLRLSHDGGVAWDISPVDGVMRIVASRKVAGGRLIALVGLPESTIYDAWIEHAVIVVGGAVVVWLLASGFSLLWVEYRRRERLERARLAQVQRLESIGQFAGGIAHDLGNTIKIARTTFTLLRPYLSHQQDAMALVEDADRSLKSAFDIIDRLLVFARRQELSPRATDLAELICGFAPLLRQAAGPRIQLDLSIDKKLFCLIDPIHLEAALLNLVLNSRDAMPDGGRIVIGLRELQAPRRHRMRDGAGPEAVPWAQIEVRDDGLGMSREVLDRAFEPFFTTRPDGSGLGLSQVLGFVQQSAGDVKIESRKGVGTTVTLLFPTTPGPEQALSPASRP
jgi:signal transduction histidine kinase